MTQLQVTGTCWAEPWHSQVWERGAGSQPDPDSSVSRGLEMPRKSPVLALAQPAGRALLQAEERPHHLQLPSL